MKKQMKVLILLSGLILTLSCTEGIYNQLGKPLRAPVAEEPHVSCFQREKEVTLSWPEDPAADEFILYRREDQPYSEREILYRGTDLSYTDLKGEGDDRFLYSLSKIRGVKEFGPSEEVLGVFSDTIMDSLEPNNTKSGAIELEYNHTGNIYYYQGEGDTKLADEDWFFMDLPPRRIGYVFVYQDVENLEMTSFTFAREEQLPFQAENNVLIPIENYSYEWKRFYFKIGPYIQAFCDDPAERGGRLASYTLTLDRITGLYSE